MLTPEFVCCVVFINACTVLIAFMIYCGFKIIQEG